ncbi:MAG: hypothetical protein HON70_26760, partial [Lentisphaerae bacterium]|nr:hypothetical protein [Lentisphaerota bacterium]
MGLLAFGLGAVYHNALTLTGYVYHMEDWQMQDLKVGMIGYGWVAGAHIGTYAAVEGTTVAAICDV